jgi:hypothetical protein
MDPTASVKVDHTIISALIIASTVLISVVL